MLKGTHQDLQGLTCPCGYSEIADELGQYQSFDFIRCSEDGIRQIWKCLKCKQKFSITLE